MGSGGRGSLTPALRPLAFVLQLALLLSLPAAGARAQSPECDQLRAALAQPVSIDAGAAAGARKARADLDRLTASAHAMGCDNQQFLIFGSPPPPQCGGVKARIAGAEKPVGRSRARASGDSPQRRALRAHYDASATPPRAKRISSSNCSAAATTSPWNERRIAAPRRSRGGRGQRRPWRLAGGLRALLRRRLFPAEFFRAQRAPTPIWKISARLCARTPR